MFHNQSVQAHRFSMVPRPDVPRAAFNIDFTHKTTMDAGYLYPIMVEEVLPGDSFSVSMTAFARLSTPIVPIMDNLHMDSFFFFVPNRLVWDNWVRFMGEQKDPADTTSYVVPKLTIGPTDNVPTSLFDYLGFPQTTGSIAVNALPLRAYNLIYNEWFRDENLISRASERKGDAGDLVTDYPVRKRAKRPDYFTSALPWPQKGAAVPISIGASAPVISSGNVPSIKTGNGANGPFQLFAGTVNTTDPVINWSGGSQPVEGLLKWWDTGMIADLSSAVSSTVNALRQSFQIQKLLERDARGGSRYTEIIRAHFGVISPDARLQRPEYLGGSSAPIQLTPVPQTSGTATSTGGYTDTPQGNLAAMGTVVARGGFSQSFTEHGYIIGLINIRADVTYAQGIRRHWWRSTRYDYYFPAFSMLGEQAILFRELYCGGVPEDSEVFGYQERWSEYRYSPNMITGYFRSGIAGTLDVWHLAQNFGSRPYLLKDFIEQNPPVERILALGSQAQGQQFLFDSVFKIRAVRPMPIYSVPGMIDHF